jgi:large conductance mechanosensitive channel
MKGFLNFVREQGVVGLAVGLILGGAVSKFVTAVIADVVQPLLGLVLGSAQGLESISFEVAGATIKIGSLLVSAIDFAVIAGVVYYVVMGLGLNKMDKKKD